MLILPIKKKWFDMILSGEKKEEYREIKPYYNSRLGVRLIIQELINGSNAKFISNIMFRNGYGKDRPTILCECEISKGYGKPELGAEPDKKYYVLKILSVKEVKNEQNS